MAIVPWLRRATQTAIKVGEVALIYNASVVSVHDDLFVRTL